ncbi:MAG: sigma-70 family RNA polymerase sigma factor [Candidatus Rokubacteria bacterium]|nr:sigma-70 family RNA polymerase sigma factor [Candidatus Rokubacteria bacterium]
MIPVEARQSGGSDQELLARLRAGDGGAVEDVVSRYAGLVYRLALRITGTPADAEEVTWEVMQTVWRKISSFRGDSALTSWIYRIATNAAYGKLRARRAPAHPLEDALYNLDEAGDQAHRDWSACCEDPAGQAELRAVLEAAIAELPPDYRTAVVLHDIEGLANAEVAEILGASLPAVKSRVHRARLALRRRLASYFASWTGQ